MSNWLDQKAIEEAEFDRNGGESLKINVFRSSNNSGILIEVWSVGMLETRLVAREERTWQELVGALQALPARKY